MNHVPGATYPTPTCVPHRKLQTDRQTDKLLRSACPREHTLNCSSWYSRYQSQPGHLSVPLFLLSFFPCSPPFSSPSFLKSVFFCLSFFFIFSGLVRLAQKSLQCLYSDPQSLLPSLPISFSLWFRPLVSLLDVADCAGEQRVPEEAGLVVGRMGDFEEEGAQCLSPAPFTPTLSGTWKYKPHLPLPPCSCWG